MSKTYDNPEYDPPRSSTQNVWKTSKKIVMSIPTAEETYLKYTQCVINNGDIKKAMVEFARLHVENFTKSNLNLEEYLKLHVK